jgi:sorting nexin-1/2
MAAAVFLDVRVGEPQRQGEGRGGYTTYKLAVSVSQSSAGFPCGYHDGSQQRGLEGFSGESFTVVRRYSDFDWFRKRLAMEAPIVAIPPLPPKDSLPLKNFKDDFIESRNRGLQRFMDRVCAHPILRSLEVTRQFVTCSEAELAEVKEATKAKVSAQVSAGFSTMVSAAGSALGSAVDRVRGTGGALAGTKTPADLSFEELEAYVNGVFAALVRAEKAVVNMTAKRREAAVRMAEYGHAYEVLATHEKEELGSALESIGKTMTRQAQMEAMQANGELRWFHEDLLDAIAVAESTKKAFANRNDVSHRLQMAKEALERRRTELERVRGDTTKQPKAEEMVASASAEVDTARETFVRVNNELLDEVGHLRAMRLADSKQMFMDFISMEAMRGEAAENLWRSVIPGAAASAEAEERKFELWRTSGADTRTAAASLHHAASATSSAPASSVAEESPAV